MAGVVYEAARPLFWGEHQDVGDVQPEVIQKYVVIFDAWNAVVEVQTRQSNDEHPDGR